MWNNPIIVTLTALTVTYIVSVTSFYTVEKFFTAQKQKFEYQ
jgi:hypothetical protein